MSKAEIIGLLPALRVEERQEILDRLYELREVKLRAAHQTWVDEAVQSGPARPAAQGDWEEALTKGSARAARHS